MQWGTKYMEFHKRAWAEVYRVLRPGGRFILNVSDHIRNGQRVPVCNWHLCTAIVIGFTLSERRDVPTPRQRYGANGKARVEAEAVLVFRKEAAR